MDTNTLISMFTANFNSFNNPLFLGILAVAGIFLFYILRFKIRNLLAMIFKTETLALDDYHIAKHHNIENWLYNEYLKYKGLISKDKLLITPLLFFGLGVSFAVSPLLITFFIIALLIYKINFVGLKMKSYQFFNDSEKIQNKIFAFINDNFQKVDFFYKELLTAAAALVFIGGIFGNEIVFEIGFTIAIILSLLSIFLNAILFAIGSKFKLVEGYRIGRLLKNSYAIDGGGLIIFAVLGLLEYADIYNIDIETKLLLISFLRLISLFLTTRFFEAAKSINEIGALVDYKTNDLTKIGSYFNSKIQTKGYKFNTPTEIKLLGLSKERKDAIFIDNFAYFDNVVNDTILKNNPLLKNSIKNNTKMYFEPIDFTKQIFILGGMGSGKTEFINNILYQVHKNNFSQFKGVIFNDIKGDFVQKFYREDKDYIVNLFDKRAAVWDIFEEMKCNIEAGTNFINNIFESIAGDDKDFFNARAKQLVSKWTQEAFFEGKNSIESWELLFKKIKDYEKNIGEDKTKSSIYATIEIVLDILTIMKYQIVEERRKTFNINDFLNNTNGRQLFLVNNAQYADKLTPYLTGIWGAIVAGYLAKEDTKEHLILNVIDEFLSLKMDTNTRTALLTACRSKGAANVLAMQYLKSDDKEILQQLDSSRYALITFNINDDFTLDVIKKKFGNVEVVSISATPKEKEQLRGGNNVISNLNPVNGINMLMGSGWSKTYTINNYEIFDTKMLQSLPKYHHLTFIPNETYIEIEDSFKKEYMEMLIYGYDDILKESIKENTELLLKNSGVLYLGYTPYKKIDVKNKNFEKWDMQGYFLKEKGAKLKSECEKYERMSKEELLKNYLMKKYKGDKKRVMEFLSGDEKLDIFDVFESLPICKDKLKKMQNRLSKEDVTKLAEQYYTHFNYDELYRFVKDNNLIGTLPQIFLKGVRNEA